MPLLPLPKPPWISRWRWPPPAMEASPTASRVPHPRDRRDCSRLAEVVGPRRAPPSLLVESVVLCGGDGAPHLRAHKPERSSTEAMASPGDTMLRECTGICIESSCPDATCFLTSTNLILYTWPRDKITESFTIKSTPSRSSGCHWVDRESSVIC
ncbi:hypothetical protein VPH35_060864 [Triticum aestivum]|uniref:Uncharacterized protein n=1 Tax=Aegilops tauschii subsp. strangulata TaxID=200361 RepID=A0A453FJN3_AEGTS|nr:uncharacterized protein LOC109754392 isoform X2 [Aegilops tauschii subsp. strangulata]XP_044357873.1 uncharacterized protein LOC123079222 isoform X1 [Triticum aestivum]